MPLLQLRVPRCLTGQDSQLGQRGLVRGYNRMSEAYFSQRSRRAYKHGPQATRRVYLNKYRVLVQLAVASMVRHVEDWAYTTDHSVRA